MFGEAGIMVAAFLAVGSLVVLVSLVVSSRQRRLDNRLQELTGPQSAASSREMVNQFTRSTLPKLAKPFLPKDEKDRTLLTTRLIHAGYYGRQAMVIYLGFKMLLVLVLPLVGIAAGFLNLVPQIQGLLFGLIAGGLGIVGPSFWLDWRKRQRQTNLRRALPDALDVLVVCLEGGLSLTAAISRVVSELRVAHPLLGMELGILQREVQLGLSSGEALREFGHRSDLEEVRSLAGVILQTERFGASLVKALKVHAESLRIKRMQRAEEMAQKAVIKVLFPTLFCIFPAMFLVILGPAVVQIIALFASMNAGNLGRPVP